MRIILCEDTVQKPIEYPITIPKNENSNLPMVIEQPKPSRTKITKKGFLKIIEPELETFQIKPVPSTKNDKTHLFIDSFANHYKEAYKLFNKFKVTNEGVYLPKQDRLFFETVITNESFKQFITIPNEISEFITQQISYTWFKSPLIKKQDNILDGIKLDKTVGCEYKLKYPGCLSLSIDLRLKEKPIRELLEMSKTMMKGEKIILQFGLQPCEHDWWKDGERAFENLPRRLNNDKQIKKTKLAQNGFECCLRILVCGQNIHRSNLMFRGVDIALKQLNGDNELIDNQIKQKKLEKWIENKVLKRNVGSSLFFKNRFILSTKEVQHFIKLPQRNLQRDFELDVNEREEIDIDKTLTRKTGVLIGHAEKNDKKIPIRIPYHNLDFFCGTTIVSGSPRMGKDTFFSNYLIESVREKDVGAFIPDVIDENGNGRGMCDTLRDQINEDKIIDLNLGDFNNPIYFGLDDVAALIGSNGKNVIADNFVKVLGLDDTTDSQELCSLIAKVCNCNIYKMYCCLRSKKYAQELYEQIDDELLALEFHHEYLKSKKDRAVSTVKTRLKMILGNPHFKHMIAQQENKEINFEKWIRERKVVLLRMKKMDIGDIGVKILMYLISLKIFWIKKIIQTDDPTFILYNEPHQYMSDGLQELIESMMSESPKYRIGVFVLFHNPMQLPSKLWEIMKSSSINFYCFKNTNWKIYYDLKEQLKPIEVDTAAKTEKYEAIYLPFVNGKQLSPLFLKTLPPAKDRMKSWHNEHLTREHAQKYGRSVNEVRNEIYKTEISLYNEGSN